MPCEGKAQSVNSQNAQIAQMIGYLDSVAQDYVQLECPHDDHYCNWFKFHVALGERSILPLQLFANKVRSTDIDSSTTASFVGEAHIGQYAAYYLLRSLPPSTKLSTGQTLAAYLDGMDWAKCFDLADRRKHPYFLNPDPSWYLVIEALYPGELPPPPSYSLLGEPSCDGSHLIIGLSFHSRHDEQLNRLLKELNSKLNRIIDDPSPGYPLNAYDQLLMSHLPETLCSLRNQKALDPEVHAAMQKFFEGFRAEYEQKVAPKVSPAEFLQERPELSYLTAEMLGHFRRGLRLCLREEKLPPRVNKY